MRRVSSWGRLSALPHEVVELADLSRVAAELARGRPGIAYGLGRSYGDECLNPDGVLWSTAGLDRFIRFDEANGRLVCEAGVSWDGLSSVPVCASVQSNPMLLDAGLLNELPPAEPDE